MNRLTRSASLFALAAIAGAGSCAHRAPTLAPSHPLLREMAAQPAASSRPASALPIASATPPSPPPPPAPAPECQKLALVDACAPPVPTDSPTALSSDQLGAWYAERGAKPPKDSTEPSCAAVKVGPDGEEALACALVRFPAAGDPSSLTHVFRVTMDWVVRAVRGRRVQTLVSIRYLMDVLDKEMAEQAPLFAVGVSLAKGGQGIVVAEPRPNACFQAAQKLAASQKEAAAMKDADERRTRLAWEKFDAKILAGICKQPRVWTWQQGTFRPLVTPGSSSGSIPFAPALGL
jgi:hypothetical protein